MRYPSMRPYPPAQWLREVEAEAAAAASTVPEIDHSSRMLSVLAPQHAAPCPDRQWLREVEAAEAAAVEAPDSTEAKV